MSTLLFCRSNFSFLTGASHPEELVSAAAAEGYHSLAITDECSVAGVVKAHVQAKIDKIQLIIGSYFQMGEHCQLLVYAPNRAAYAELCGLITLARRRSPKGEYQLEFNDLQFRLKKCLVIWQATPRHSSNQWLAKKLSGIFKQRLWLGVSHSFLPGEQHAFAELQQLAEYANIPLIASDRIVMHEAERKSLQDTLSAIRLGCSVQQLGNQAEPNAESYIKPLDTFYQRYPEELIHNAADFAAQFHFSLDELRYEYPQELVPPGVTPIQYLRQLTEAGARVRWPQGVSKKVRAIIEHEMTLIEELNYEYYFLTVYDIVAFAKGRNILCQGRGSAANSVVCYCLGVTEVSPDLINVLFERFISKERDEPPDIDVDFEHQRREEVIQYIYEKYGRERAALTATVITYRARSAMREVGKALGFDLALLDHISKDIAWWERTHELKTRFAENGFDISDQLLQHFYQLIQTIIGFPRHLSQHVGGFVISQGKISELVPIENAAMAGRTVIQWDKTDIEALGLLKVDVLALGMLSALRRGLELVHSYNPAIKTLQDIPKEDPATYAMLSRADSVGVFQVESRAQMAMLPRLRPKCFYDLVIEIAIVRPGPIQGDMVHPYLRRRNKEEPVSYPSEAIRHVLEPTLGVPIFQEQAIRIAMVAAGFGGGEADQLRRAMAAWGRNGNLLNFKDKLINGMLARGYELQFAERMFEQLKGFGGYGFPESHSASFAILCYLSSWLKCHHPAAFYTALLNSQPMGFYSPSQLVQDAQRHGVIVLPVDVTVSQWDHTLEQPPSQINPDLQHKQNNQRQQTDQLNLNANNLSEADLYKAGSLGIIRLGLRCIKGLDENTAHNIINARKKSQTLKELAHAAGLTKADLNLLASADALKSLSGHRHQAHWVASGIEPNRPLLDNVDATAPYAMQEEREITRGDKSKEVNKKLFVNTGEENKISVNFISNKALEPKKQVHSSQTELKEAARCTQTDAQKVASPSKKGLQGVSLPSQGIITKSKDPQQAKQNYAPSHNFIEAPQEVDDVYQDYEHTGLSLRRHPLALLRNQYPFNRCKKAAELNTIHHGGFVRVAGLVTGRQRPGTAKGVLFLTLEDETGNMNVVVWKTTQERYRSALLTSKLLVIKGTVETDGDVIHVIAGDMVDASESLAGVLVGSRDFC
ncbi:error-prone DNA polymerase [Halioxenophilus aromaticivorans]|uniref:Error-prone DNA polymerase n=1 Tax=Halioxenophilus aromaticivorans TaxID=1306992 RepID=A0AAV3TXD9_9ALTE